MSGVTCHMSHVMCHLSHGKKIQHKKIGLTKIGHSAGASRLRVGYQRGLLRLVYKIFT